MHSEFDLIQNLKEKYRLSKIGDDCAVIPRDGVTDTVISSDMLVEEIDFRLDWTTPELLGHKALAVSLSDVAAMGATAEWAMLSIGIPESLWYAHFLDRFYEGWHKLARAHTVELVGGDLSKTIHGLVIDSTVIGSVPRGEAVLRSGAAAGNGIYVSGGLGAASAGLRLLQGGRRLSDHGSDEEEKNLILSQLRPIPRADVAEMIRADLKATAMIDVSDGLSSDLAHICNASGTGARLEAAKIPIVPAVEQVIGPGSEILDLALHGGEDFELIFTVDEKNTPAAKLARFHRVGEITANAGIIELLDGHKVTELMPRGFRHF